MNQLDQKIEHILKLAESTSEVRPGAWTPVQVLDHLCIAHGVFLAGLDSNSPLPKQSISSKMKYKMVMFILKNGIPVPAKGAFPTVDPNAPVREKSVMLQRLHRQVSTKLETSKPGTIAFNHPVAGPLGKEDAVNMVAAHLQYHIKRFGK